MPDEYTGIEELDLGVQADGEPAVVTEATPEAAPEVAATPEAEAKPEGDAKPEDTPEQPHKKTGSQRARERAEREAALRAQVERERDELRARLEAASKPPAADPDEPVLENFETLDAWKAALVTHAQKKAADLALKEFEAKQQQQAAKEAQKKWQEADAKFAEKTPDWEDVIEDLTETIETLPQEYAPGFMAIGAALNASEIAPAIKYHLGKNPGELRRIAALNPVQVIKEIGKLEVKLSEPPPTKQPSSAPPPVRPVSGGSAVVADTKYGGIEEF